MLWCSIVFFFQAEDGIRDDLVTGVQTCALPIFLYRPARVVPLRLAQNLRVGELAPNAFESKQWRVADALQAALAELPARGRRVRLREFCGRATHALWGRCYWHSVEHRRMGTQVSPTPRQ